MPIAQRNVCFCELGPCDNQVSDGLLEVHASRGLACVERAADTAAIQAAQTIKVYPLSDPTKVLKYVDVTGKDIAGSSVPWEDNIQYWQKLHQVLDFESVLDEYRAMYGVLSQLGIEKGKPFDPDSRRRT